MFFYSKVVHPCNSVHFNSTRYHFFFKLNERQSAMPRHRAPHGVVTSKPIALRFLPEELKQVKELAEADRRPLANMCRLLVLRGIDDFKRKQAALNAR